MTRTRPVHVRNLSGRPAGGARPTRDVHPAGGARPTRDAHPVGGARPAGGARPTPHVHHAGGTRRARLAAATAGLALLLAACGGGSDDDADPAPEESVTAAETASAGTDTPTDRTGAPENGETPTGEGSGVDSADHLTDPALLDQVEWVLTQLEADATGPEESELEERFSAEMLAQAPPAQLIPVFEQLRGGAPYTVTQVAEAQTPMSTATVLLDSAVDPLVMTLTVDGEGRLTGLFFQPDTSGEAPEIGSWEDLDDAVGELGGETQVVVASVSEGRCTPLHTTAGLEEGGIPAPSGSVFKLVVLAAVADAVEDGGLDWADELTITDEIRSLPSGVLQERPAGDTVTVEEAAGLMISISDNTATDLLLEAVGEEQVAATAEAAGLDVSRVLPVASTGELFRLGWQVGDDVRAEWSEAALPEERRVVLDALPAELDLGATAVTEPRWQDGVDWMLTGGEICALHALLQEQAGSDAGAPVRGILAENPGLVPPDDATYQGFKGGSAPGVLAFSFYVETADGEGRVLVVQTRSDQPIDQMRATTIVTAALAHLVEN